MSICFLGELIRYFVPFNIPSGIYGLLILLLLLIFKILRVEQVKEVSVFLIDNMTVMLVPAGIGIIISWHSIQSAILPLFIITIISTVVIMGSTASFAQFFISLLSKDKDESIQEECEETLKDNYKESLDNV